jgi:hypothetical protein
MIMTKVMNITRSIRHFVRRDGQQLRLSNFRTTISGVDNFMSFFDSFRSLLKVRDRL